MRFISARIHGMLDFVVVILFLLGPLLMGLGGSPAAISYTLAVIHLVMTLMTRFPAGRWKTPRSDPDHLCICIQMPSDQCAPRRTAQVIRSGPAPTTPTAPHTISTKTSTIETRSTTAE